jgi:hypothetical protein
VIAVHIAQLKMNNIENANGLNTAEAPPHTPHTPQYGQYLDIISISPRRAPPPRSPGGNGNSDGAKTSG